MSHSAKDRRRNRRIERVFHGSLLRAGFQDIRIRAMDLSPDGALLDLGFPLTPGAEVEFAINVQDRWQVPVRGKVLRVYPVFGGRRFLTSVSHRPLNDEDRSRLSAWVSHQEAG